MIDPPALRRLARFGEPSRGDGEARRARSGPQAMGYQPGLDGLRAISVIAVMLYHAGFTWMHGGFFGVEVFFVVSGFLITSLLLDERERTGAVSLRQFWLRRARRLLPAVFTMLAAISAWGALFGSAEQQSQLRRDLPWSIFYVGNWGQILGDMPYYSGSPPLLRHLWSLAVEEQWYLLWPLAFVALGLLRWSPARRATVLAGLALASMVFMFWLHAGGPSRLGGPPALLDGTDRVNFMYLSTFTRASGLLLGAAAAFVWRPWRSLAPDPAARRVLDPVGGAAVGTLLCIFGVAVLTEGYIYQWLLPLVSVLSLVAVLVVVHPAAAGMRAVFAWGPLVEIGKRSYGLYLWSWPISVFVGARTGSVARFLLAMVISAVCSELCYRYVETPVRKGALGRWWRDRPTQRLRVAGGAALVTGVLALFYANVTQFDRARDSGDQEVAAAPIEVTTTVGAAAPSTDPAAPATDPAAPATDPATQATTADTAPATPVATAPTLPRRLVIVGDSQAHAFFINLPSGVEQTFTVSDGSVEGCGVYDTGTVRSARDSFNRSFADCAGWAAEWGAAAASADAEVAAVVLGAWDVFDIEVDGTLIPFGTAAADDFFLAGLQQGIDALTAAGTHAALIEVPCMRPKDVQGAGVPALPERGDDARVAHLNDLLRRAAAADPGHVTFVAGPAEWCTDPAIATDLGYRWDGVHVYKPGAKLIFDTIAPALLTIPV